jgi:D-alanyl-D-alanine carboxypeptidase (penicillin-binding protein 5/6)
VKFAKKIVIVFLLISLIFISTVVVWAQEQEQLTSLEEISVPSAILIEASQGKILFEKNSHEKRPGASLTTIMTMLIVMEEIESGKLSFDDILTAQDDVASITGSHVWIKSGENITLLDALKSVAMISASDAAIVIADKISGSQGAFVSRMQTRAGELGMFDTVFKNCNGTEQEGNVTSAYDIALMSREISKYPEISDFTSTWMDSIRNGKTQIVNTNKLLKSFNGTTGLKTGTTLQAGSCISATASREDLSLIAVVLGCKTGVERFENTTKILDFGFTNFTTVEPQPPSQGLNSVKILGGVTSSVDVKLKSGVEILVRKGKEKLIKSKIEMLPEVQAPVRPGQRIGKVSYELEGEVLLECPIEISKSVDRLNFFSSFTLLLRNLLTM